MRKRKTTTTTTILMRRDAAPSFLLLLLLFIAMLLLAATTATTTTAAKSTTTTTTSFNVVLWGDVPYLGSAEDVFDPTDPLQLPFENGEEVSVGTVYGRLRDSINNNANSGNNDSGSTSGSAAVQFALHTGDIKQRTGTCLGGRENRFWRRFQDLADSLAVPTFYTPGDNEWTDCYGEWDWGRFWYGNQRSPLRYIRERFFPDPSGRPVLGSNTEAWDAPVTTARNDGYPELQRFVYGDVLFVLVHVVGTNNNRWATCWEDLFFWKNDYEQGCYDDFLRLFWTDFCCLGARAEYNNRNAAVNEFLRGAFAEAVANDNRGVMVVGQAIIVDFEDGFASPPKLYGDGFDDFWNTLTEETLAFGKPVAYVHGDFHFFQDYQPDPIGVPNLQALMVPGGKFSIGWVNATIDTSENATALFTFEHVDIWTQPDDEQQADGDSAIRFPPSGD